MDSLTAVELKQILERDFGIYITTSELHALTFEKLRELTDSTSKVGKPVRLQRCETEATHKILFQTLGDEKTANEIVVPLNVADGTDSDTIALLIPGIEGVINPTLPTLCNSIEVPIFALQYHAHWRIESFAEFVPVIANVINCTNLVLCKVIII